MKFSTARIFIAVLLVAGGLGAAPAASDERPGFWPKKPGWPNLFIAPNPVSDAGVISYQVSSDGEASLELFSLNGSLVNAWQLRGTPGAEGHFQIQLGGIAPGVYVLVLTQTVNGRSAVTGTFKVVVRH